MTVSKRSMRVFISYTHADVDRANILSSALQETGFNTLMADVVSTPGAAAAELIEEELRVNAVVVVLVSSRYIQHGMPRSFWLAAALERRRVILPITLDGTDTTAHIGPFVSIDARGGSAAMINLVIDALQGRRPSLHRSSAAELFANLVLARTHAADPRRDPAKAKLTVKNLPSYRAGTLIGRDDLLSSLYQEAQSKPVVQVLVGGGGGGKSQIALEYAHRHADEYDVVWWVRSTAPSRIHEDINELGNALGISRQAVQWDDSLKAVREWLERSGESNGRWLLVFDDAFDADAVESYIPASTPGAHVMITTRRSRVGDMARGTVVSVGSLDSSAAAEYLSRITGRENSRSAERVAKRLNYWSLSLEQAAYYISLTGVSYKHYLVLLDAEVERNLRAQDSSKKQRSKNLREPSERARKLDNEDLILRSAVGINYLAASQVSPDAGRLLSRLSLCDSSTMSMRLVEAISHQGKVSASNIRILTRLGLARVNDSLGVSIPAEVREAVRRRCSATEIEANATSLVRDFYAVSSSLEDFDSESELRWEDIVSHAAAVLEVCDQIDFGSRLVPERRLLMRRIGRYSQARGDSSMAATMYAKAFRLNVRSSESAMPDMLKIPDSYVILNDLATALAQEGDLSEAVRISSELSERYGSPAGREGTDADALRLVLINNLAAALADTGRIADSEELLSECLSGLSRPDVENLLLTSPSRLQESVRSVVHNLATTHVENGRFREALDLYDLVINSFGSRPSSCPVTVETVESLIGYSNALGRLGRQVESLSLCRRVLAEAQPRLGPFHPATLTCLDQLAAASVAARRLADAVSYTESAYLRRMESAGRDHPRTLDALTNLISVLRLCSEDERARVLLEELVERSRRSLGRQHPRTIAAVRELGVISAHHAVSFPRERSFGEVSERGRDSRIPRDDLFGDGSKVSDVF